MKVRDAIKVADGLPQDFVNYRIDMVVAYQQNGAWYVDIIVSTRTWKHWLTCEGPKV